MFLETVLDVFYSEDFEAVPWIMLHIATDFFVCVLTSFHFLIRTICRLDLLCLRWHIHSSGVAAA